LQIQFNQHDLSVLADSLSLFRPTDPGRGSLANEAFQVLRGVQPDQTLELSAIHLEAVLEAVTVYSTRVSTNRREMVENTTATITRMLLGGD
jgi:hypothetical protein